MTVRIDRYSVTCTDMTANRDFEFTFTTLSWDLHRNPFWQAVANDHLKARPDYNPEHTYTMWAIYFVEEVNA